MISILPEILEQLYLLPLECQRYLVQDDVLLLFFRPLCGAFLYKTDKLSFIRFSLFFLIVI